jgi:hypothetical protein
MPSVSTYDGFFIHTHLCWHKGNVNAIRSFEKCVKTLEIHWSKFRLWLKDKGCFAGFRPLYLFSYHKSQISKSVSKLFNQWKMSPPPPPFMITPSPRNICRYTVNKKMQKERSGINIQQGQYPTSGGHQTLEKYMQSCWKMTPGYIFNGFRSQFSTEKKHPRFNIQR